MVEPTSPSDGKPPPRPRWVTISGIVAVVVIVGAVLVMALAGGDHGPGRHLPGGDDAGHEAPVDHAP